MATLGANEIWKKLDAAQQGALLISVGLASPVKPDVSSDEALGRYLDSRPLKVALAERDAIPGRVQQAIEAAAKLLEPKVQTVTLERSTLHCEPEIAIKDKATDLGVRIKDWTARGDHRLICNRLEPVSSSGSVTVSMAHPASHPFPHPCPGIRQERAPTNGS